MPQNRPSAPRRAPRWVVSRPPRPAADLRLFCFPYAGGGSSIFRSWAGHLDGSVEVCPVLLPGREERFGEPPHTRVTELVPLLADRLAGWFDKPFAFFGHSMGGEIAFALAEYLCARGPVRPGHVFVSGCVPVPGPVLRHTLPDPELLAEIREMNGAPAEFLNNPELIELMLPTLRADFTLAENAVPDPAAVLPVPLTVFAGTDDPEAGPRQAKAWSRHAGGAFELYELAGDHFFLHDAGPLLDIVGRVLSSGSGPGTHGAGPRSHGSGARSHGRSAPDSH
ncbi:thioesterase domain-containing protein [Streptomyces sp. 35G-GA-8]|uniref:thioesterase II family protein n=1 Tax=Streptomyces sp. 35G-GA-8 TaxID=2939434 RepID=UPI00201F511C|nr:thioesterase domain-containing protein [Streptomyces sp. 35G-GA-8]MCL7376808.1 thioesterase domain-containing protein [Streptomyces sp. 35G-GA-8]